METIPVWYRVAPVFVQGSPIVVGARTRERGPEFKN